MLKTLKADGHGEACVERNGIIYGKGQQEIKYSLPDLFHLVSDEFPNFDADEITLTSTNLFRIEAYQDFICSKIDYQCEAIDLITKQEIYIKR